MQQKFDMTNFKKSTESSKSFESLGLRDLSRNARFGTVHSKKMLTFGYGLVVGSIVTGILFLYAAVVFKMMPITGNYVLNFMNQDHYFCYLIPLMVLPTYIVIYLNWLSTKMFQHN